MRARRTALVCAAGSGVRLHRKRVPGTRLAPGTNVLSGPVSQGEWGSSSAGLSQPAGPIDRTRRNDHRAPALLGHGFSPRRRPRASASQELRRQPHPRGWAPTGAASSTWRTEGCPAIHIRHRFVAMARRRTGLHPCGQSAGATRRSRRRVDGSAGLRAGSVVTISGDNSDGAGYVAGITVDVAVSGPNGWTSSRSATVGDDELNSWSCQLTLDSDRRSPG